MTEESLDINSRKLFSEVNQNEKKIGYSDSEYLEEGFNGAEVEGKLLLRTIPGDPCNMVLTLDVERIEVIEP